MKKITFFLSALLISMMSFAETATLTFGAACEGKGTDDKGNAWVVTSDAAESQYDATKGVHYGTSKVEVSYLQVSTSAITSTVTKIVVNASGASKTAAKLNVTVGGAAFGSEVSLTSTATEYTFEGNATGEIVVKLTQTSAKKALYVKSIVVTDVAGGETPDPTPDPEPEPDPEPTPDPEEPETPVLPEGVITCAEAAELALGGSTAEVTIHGYVTSIAYAYDAGYNNVSFWMADTKDGGNVFEAYRSKPTTDADKAVKVGDYVEVTGQLTVYNSTPETKAGGTYTILEATTELPVNLGEKTIAEFLELKNTIDTCVLTGVVSNIVSTEYGNFDLVDATGKVYVYGLLTAAGVSKQFASMDIAEGDTLTVKAIYNEYNGNPQAKNAIYVSHTKKATQEPEPEPEPDPTPDPEDPEIPGEGGDNVTYVFADDTSNPGNAGDWFTGTIDAYSTWTATKGGNNNPKYYDSGTGLRVYNGGTFTITSTKLIETITLTFSTSSYTFSADNTETPQTVTVNANSYEWSVGRTCRLQKIEITYGNSDITIVKTLKSIALSGMTTIYETGDVFNFNGTCIATYAVTKDDIAQDEEQKEVTPTSVSEPDMTTAGEKEVIVTYTEDDVTVTATYTITVNLAEGDKLVLETTGVEGAVYADWSNVEGASGAVYAGNSAGGNNSIQLRKSASDKPAAGIITTTSGGLISKVKVSWNINTADGRTLNVYGKNTAYTAVSELYDAATAGELLGTIVEGTSTELVIDGDFEYVGIVSANGALYLDKVVFVWEENETPDGPGTTLDNITIDTNITKTIENGQLIIIKDGVKYNAQGQVVK